MNNLFHHHTVFDFKIDDICVLTYGTHESVRTILGRVASVMMLSAFGLMPPSMAGAGVAVSWLFWKVFGSEQIFSRRISLCMGSFVVSIATRRHLVRISVSE